MKEFYQVANKVLRIKRNHPVVTRVKRESEVGETEVFEDRQQVEQVIARYFEQVYKRPDHMPSQPDEDSQADEEMINTTATFSLDDIREATK
jgi:hypothetical protein